MRNKKFNKIITTIINEGGNIVYRAEKEEIFKIFNSSMDSNGNGETYIVEGEGFHFWSEGFVIREFPDKTKFSKKDNGVTTVINCYVEK